MSKCKQIHSVLRIWSHLLKRSLIELFIFCAVWKRVITFEKAEGTDKDNYNTYWISFTCHMSNMIRWDDDINTSYRHFRFYFPWWPNYGTVLKYFNIYFLTTYIYANKFRSMISTVYKLELWKPLWLRYDCTKFHLTGEEMLEEGGVKSCPLNKGAITKDQFWMSLFYFSYSRVRNVPGRLPKTCLFRPSRFITNAFLRKIIKK